MNGYREVKTTNLELQFLSIAIRLLTKKRKQLSIKDAAKKDL